MLNKVLVMTIVASIFSALRVLVPDLPIPEGIEAAIATVVMFVAGWFTRESQKTVGALDLKK